MNPDFHVNMSLGEYSEYESRKKQQEAQREFMFFTVKFLVPFFLIWIGYAWIGIEGKFMSGMLLMVSGVVYLSLSIYYFLLRSHLMNKKYSGMDMEQPHKKISTHPQNHRPYKQYSNNTITRTRKKGGRGEQVR